MVLNALILMFLPCIASQCMDYQGFRKCPSTFSDTDLGLLECMNICLTKSGEACRLIKWEPQAKLCNVDTTFSVQAFSEGPCATFMKTACNTIPDGQSLQADMGYTFVGGRLMTFVTSLVECKTICAIDSTCQASTWRSERRECTRYRHSKDRSRIKLGHGNYQVIKKGLRLKGRCVVLNAGGNSGQGKKEQNVNSLTKCIETVLNTSKITSVDWNLGNNDCWSHHSKGETKFSNPTVDLIQLQKYQGCRMWRGAVSITKLENTKMSGGLKLKGLSEKDCVELCQLVSNCAAVGWSNVCIFHHLELSTEEDPSSTLYTTGGSHITTSATTVSSSTTNPMTSTSTDSTTAAAKDGLGTFVEAFFIRRDFSQLTSTSQRRASVECAVFCFRSNCSDFTSAILKDDSVCGMSGSEPPGRSPKKHFEWIKL